MAYSKTDFERDAVATARTMHLAFRRGQFLLARWFAGMNTECSGDNDMGNLMTRVAEMQDDYSAYSNAKLNTVMAKSDLTLPGDPE